MALFQKQKKVIQVGGQKIVLEPKPSKSILSRLFARKPKPKPQPIIPPLKPSEAVHLEQLAKKPGTAQPPAKEERGLFGRKKPAPTILGVPTKPMEVPKLTTEREQPTVGVTKEEKAAVGQLVKEGVPSAQKQLTEEERIRELEKTVAQLKPQAQQPQPRQQPQPAQPKLAPPVTAVPKPAPVAPPAAAGPPKPQKKHSKYLNNIVAKNKGLSAALAEQGIREDVFAFVKRMLIASAALAVVLAITFFILFDSLLSSSSASPLSVAIEALIIAGVLAAAVFQFASRSFLQYPFSKAKKSSKNVERDILFAARDLIISLRSGMPLFNAITLVSKGYGDASTEFAKIVDRVQLGMPLEEAIDDTIAQSKSDTFKRIMLQASVSIKAGADVVQALQSIIDQVSQERIIEMRSYGQKLNAIAMFYMLFGVILPSMGVAVLTILTTFIPIVPVTPTVLWGVVVFLFFMQIVFLKLITGSRPIFTL